jgi:hypothetical protein
MAGISPAEHAERRARLLEHAARDELTGVVLFDADYIRYFTGFNFLATERPVAVAIADGAVAAFVPEFEVERTRAEADFERIDSYPEYPGEVHPMELLAGVLADVGDGFVELTVPVACDQTGDAKVTVTFVTGTPDRPAGGIATTEDRPRGPAVIVENWHEPLIAFCWHTLVIATSALSSAIGSDLAGNALVTAAFAASAEGLAVTPMGRHTFTAGQL